MGRASVSELKKSLRWYFRKVMAGEEVLVTDRDRPFAKIVPLRRYGFGEVNDIGSDEIAAKIR